MSIDETLQADLKRMSLIDFWTATQEEFPELSRKAVNFILPFTYENPLSLIVIKRHKTSQEWLSRQMTDPYVEKAKKMNYRCRSAFKLIEMNEKTNILSPGITVVDLGASPGSWTQVAVQKTNANGSNPKKPKGTVLSIDKLQMIPVEGATIFNNMDFSTIEAHDKVIAALNGKKVDLVLSDMAPSATGVKEIDKDRIIDKSRSSMNQLEVCPVLELRDVFFLKKLSSYYLKMTFDVVNDIKLADGIIELVTDLIHAFHSSLNKKDKAYYRVNDAQQARLLADSQVGCLGNFHINS
ncbi:rRNA methyltransferase 2, mitochondrial [Eumeta japonica]|uniref:rRNA methyltransferase 2, mitochondrial n=1 Tax=Eumeta variegata TaxID=151549 RepID=A0A4C1VDI7_EUMVA|nr:rRNA methyltransferase 2, mitochondrial [Eumeta japonica]